MESIPSEVLERLAATVQEIVETPELAEFAIARGVEPARECGALGADAVVEVYRTDDADEALAVERALATRFAAHPKARVEPIALREPAPAGEVVRVFLALWAGPGV